VGQHGNHGIPDADIWHGIRNATHKIDMDDDLTMLIGPARDGAPLELGVARARRRRPGDHPRVSVTSQVLPVPGL